MEQFVQSSSDDPLVKRQAVDREAETRPGHLRKLEAMSIFVERWRDGIDPKHYPEMIELLNKFSSFVFEYINLLKQIPPSIATPREILATGLEQLYHEWSVLSRASEQRLEAVGSNADLGEKLDIAQDNLREYFDRWRGMGDEYLPLRSGDGRSRVVVYFDKVYAISRSVYAPEIPVISIPITDYEPQQRWQAMAHEAGHYLYWNALDLEATDVLQEEMRNLMAKALSGLIPGHEGFTGDSMVVLAQSLNRMATWQSWTEEVFADAVGTLLAGPTYVATAQDLASERVGQEIDFTLDDREHPCPYLRPLICLETLRQMTKQTESKEFRDLMEKDGGVIENLESRWKTFCTEKAYTQTHRFSGVKMKELGNDVKPIVAQLLHGEIWPTDKRLLDIVAFFGQHGISEKERKGIEEMLNGLSALSPLKKFYEQPQAIPVPEHVIVPQSLQRLWDYLSNRSNAASLKKGENELTSWHLLLTLGLSDDHNHETAHSACVRHWFLGSRHKHDPNSGEIVYC